MYSTYQSSDTYTPITSLDLNFELPLEDDIPPSYLPTSQCINPLSIKITIIRKRNYFKLQGKDKLISTVCQIDRYNLPSTLKSKDTPILMDRSIWNKLDSNHNLDLIQFEAPLSSEYIDTNSIMVVPLTLIIPDSNMKIKEIYVVIKEHQKFRNAEKGTVYFNASEKILEYEFPGENVEVDDEVFIGVY